MVKVIQLYREGILKPGWQHATRSGIEGTIYIETVKHRLLGRAARRARLAQHLGAAVIEKPIPDLLDVQIDFMGDDELVLSGIEVIVGNFPETPRYYAQAWRVRFMGRSDKC